MTIARPLPWPGRLPMKGDANEAWHAWWNACDGCVHRSARFGCIRFGVVVYDNGREAGFPTIPGGCKAYEAKATSSGP